MNVDSKELNELKKLLESYTMENGAIAAHVRDSFNACVECYVASPAGLCYGTCKGTCGGGCNGY